MFFSDAFQAVQEGRRVARLGWGSLSSTGPWITLSPDEHDTRPDADRLILNHPDGRTEPYRPNERDLHAEDWRIVEDP